MIPPANSAQAAPLTAVDLYWMTAFVLLPKLNSYHLLVAFETFERREIHIPSTYFEKQQNPACPIEYIIDPYK